MRPVPPWPWVGFDSASSHAASRPGAVPWGAVRSLSTPGAPAVGTEHSTSSHGAQCPRPAPWGCGAILVCDGLSEKTREQGSQTKSHRENQAVASIEECAPLAAFPLRWLDDSSRFSQRSGLARGAGLHFLTRSFWAVGAFIFLSMK